jgi:hypothetical protein
MNQSTVRLAGAAALCVVLSGCNLFGPKPGPAPMVKAVADPALEAALLAIDRGPPVSARAANDATIKVVFAASLSPAAVLATLDAAQPQLASAEEKAAVANVRVLVLNAPHAVTCCGTGQ